MEKLILYAYFYYIWQGTSHNDPKNTDEIVSLFAFSDETGHTDRRT
jgi:hypothetical protein